MPVAAPAVVIIHRWLRTVPAVVLVLAMLAPAHAQPVVDPPERPAPEGLLDLGGEGYVGGRFVTAPGVEGGRDTLPWQAPAFAAPLEVRLDGVRAIRFAPPPVVDPGPRLVHLRGGDVLSGSVVALDEETLTLARGDAGGGRLSISRSVIESIARPGSGGGSFDGPGGLLGWRQSPPGTWREEAGRLLGAIPGCAVSRDVAAPPRARFDILLSWRVRPEFRIALGPADDEGPDRFWLEAVDADGRPTLMLVRREATGARLEPIDVDLAATDRIRLVLFVDRDAGRMAVIVPAVADTPLADVVLPSAPSRAGSGGFRLALHAGDVCLERLTVTPWQADEPTLDESRGAVVVTADGRLTDVDVAGFGDAAGGSVWRFGRGGGPLTVPDEDVLEVRFATAARDGADEPQLRAVLANGDRVSGRLHAVDDRGIVLACRGIAEPVPLPFARLVIVQGSGSPPTTELPGRVGTLSGESLSLRGCLVRSADGASTDDDPGADGDVAWLPTTAVRAVTFRDVADGALTATIDYVAADTRLAEAEEWVGGIGGVVNQDAEGRMAVTMLTEDGAAARDGRLLPGDRITAVRCSPQAPFVDTAGLETETVMNLLRGRVGTPVVLRVMAAAGGVPREIEITRGPIGVFGREVLETALKTHARHAVPVAADEDPAGWPAIAFFRDGDVVRCRVAAIDEHGARLVTPVGPDAVEHDVPAEVLQAIELIPAAPSRVLDAVRVERLLTVPRIQRDRPPTHLLRLLDGDYLRGRLESLDRTTARIEVLGMVQDVPRAAVARVIWLHEASPDEGPADERAADANADRTVAADVADGLPVRAEWGDGRRLRFRATDLADERLRGRNEALGDVEVAVDDVDRVRLGAAAADAPADRPYARWRLRAAPLPRVLRDAAPP